MPRVHSKKAGKDYPEIGVKKGETYYSWTFYRGATQRSKTYPKGSQLTNKEEQRLACEAQEVEFSGWDYENREDLASELDTAIDLLQQAIDCAQEKHDNMEQAFQGGNPYMEELTEFVDACESAKSELEDLKSSVEGCESAKDWDEVGDLESVSWPG